MLIFTKNTWKNIFLEDQKLKREKSATPYFKIYIIMSVIKKKLAKNINIWPPLKSHQVGLFWPIFDQFFDRNWSWGGV